VKNADPYAIKFQQTVRKCICRTCKNTDDHNEPILRFSNHAQKDIMQLS